MGSDLGYEALAASRLPGGVGIGRWGSLRWESLGCLSDACRNVGV